MADNEVFDFTSVINLALKNLQSKIHTITIAKITQVNEKTIDCQPVINAMINGVDTPLPPFQDVPVAMLYGDLNSYIAVPLKKDGYVVLFIMERCFDNWWNGSDFLPPLELRMHDYSDAIAQPIINPLSTAIALPSNMKINSDGKIELITGADLDIKATGNVNINSGGDTNITGSGAYNIDAGSGDVKIKGGNVTLDGDCKIGSDGASLIPITKGDFSIANITFSVDLSTGQGLAIAFTGTPAATKTKIE